MDERVLIVGTSCRFRSAVPDYEHSVLDRARVRSTRAVRAVLASPAPDRRFRRRPIRVREHSVRPVANVRAHTDGKVPEHLPVAMPRVRGRRGNARTLRLSDNWSRQRELASVRSAAAGNAPGADIN